MGQTMTTHKSFLRYPFIAIYEAAASYRVHNKAIEKSTFLKKINL